MALSSRQRKLRFASLFLFLSILIMIILGWRFVRPELGKLYIVFWGGCLILSLIVIWIASEELKEIARYYVEKRREVIHKTLGKNVRRKR